MSIASELTALNGYILGAYDEINDKGGTVPANKNMANLASAIGSISGGGGGGSDRNAQPRLTGYDRNTGELTGTNLGTSGTVYVLDRMQNKGIAMTTSSWSDTSIILSTPVDLANLTGTTSIWVVPTDGAESTKLMLRGDIAVTGYGILYYMNDEGAVQTLTLTSSSSYSSLIGDSGTATTKQFTIEGVSIFNDQIVGIQFGASMTSFSIGSFLANCWNLNQPIDLSNITSFSGYSFLSNCYSFDQPISMPNYATLPNGFLSDCQAFNQPLDLSGVTSISNFFMRSCYAFNQPLDLSNVDTIGYNFLSSCYAFNQPLDLSNVETIGYSFLSGCNSFNQPLSLPKISSTNNYFLLGCYAFNQPLDLPNVSTIGTYFMQDCHAFNQPLDLSRVTYIGNYFLYHCYSYNKKITLGSARVGTYFMYQCYSLSQVDVGSSTISSNNYSLAGTSTTARIYINGITLTGANASTWKSTLADRTSSPYRKLIDGTV